MSSQYYEVFARHAGQFEYIRIAEAIEDRDEALSLAHNYFDDGYGCEAVSVWSITQGLFGENPMRIMSRSVPW